jgi:hypothetical protein
LQVEVVVEAEVVAVVLVLGQVVVVVPVEAVVGERGKR